MIEETFQEIAGHVALAIEAAVVLIVAFGSLQALLRVVQHAFSGLTPEIRQDIWLRYASWIILALEFALAADIIRSAIAPTWESIGKLAAIALIRTALNYFLAKDMENVAERRRRAAESREGSSSAHERA